MTSRLVACLWTLVVSAGCVTEHFRAETTLLPDGSVDRVIWQALDQERHKQWQEVQSGIQDQRLASELWEVADNTVKGKDGKPTNPKEQGTTARGHFASAEQIPEHYRKDAPAGLTASTLKRKSEQDDFIFVTEHRWEETLTDCVHLEDVPAARRELIDLVVPILVETLGQELGPDYDVAEVERWLRDEGAIWFDELTALFLDLAARNNWPQNTDKVLKQQAEQRLAKINLRHGLANLEEVTIKQFCEAKVKQLVKRRDDKPLDDQMAAEIFRRMLSPAEGESKGRFEQRSEEVIKSKHRSEEAFKEQLQTRFVRIVGLHHGVLQTPQLFDYRQTMPGFVVETNGVVLAENRVRWRFPATQAFPLGYTMQCRSLQPNEANQKAVFNDAPIKTRSDCERLVRLLRAKPEWRDVLKQCVANKSREPLLELRRKFQHVLDFKERSRFDDLATLLLPEPMK